MTPKPGWKTSEFWLTLVASIIGLMAAGGFFAIDSVWGKIIGFSGSILASLGYTYGRSLVKKSAEDGTTSRLADIILWVLSRFFPIKTPLERKQAKRENQIKELEDYHMFLENRLSVAIIKKKSMDVALYRRELRDIVDNLLRLRQEAAGDTEPQ